MKILKEKTTGIVSCFFEDCSRVSLDETGLHYAKRTNGGVTSADYELVDVPKYKGDTTPRAWRYNDGEFSMVDGTLIGQEPVSVPKSVTMRQARLALSAAGLLASVNAAIEAASEEAQIEWEYAATVDRDSALLQQIGAGLGLTDEQLDTLFIAAGNL